MSSCLSPLFKYLRIFREFPKSRDNLPVQALFYIEHCWGSCSWSVVNAGQRHALKHSWWGINITSVANRVCLVSIAFITCIYLFSFNFLEQSFLLFFFSPRKAVEAVLNKEHNIGGVLLKVDRCSAEKNPDEVWHYVLTDLSNDHLRSRHSFVREHFVTILVSVLKGLGLYFFVN